MTDNATPREIVDELDKFIIGQHAAKRAVAIALRNRYRRRMLREDLRDEVIPKNILMIGPTGVGKTEIARRLATLAHAPFIKVEATKFTEVGYVGRDVDSMVRDLVQVSIRMVEQEKQAEVKEKAADRAIGRIVDILKPPHRAARRAVSNAASSVKEGIDSGSDFLNQLFRSAGLATAGVVPPGASSSGAASTSTVTAQENPDEEKVSKEKIESEERVRRVLHEQVATGARDTEQIEIEVEESQSSPVLHILGGGQDGPPGQGMSGDNDMSGMLSSLLPKRRKKRSVTIGEAREIFALEEAQALIDHDQVTRDAVHRAEQDGIIFVDEMDKIAGRGGDSGRGPDVSREGVQRDILPIIEGSTVPTKWGPVRTDYMLFICAGAFHLSKPSDLIPELQGRLPIRVELDSLTEEDFVRILTEPKNALVTQYTELLATEGVILDFRPDSINELARTAALVNTQMENIGARRLHTIMERLLDELSFEAPYGDLRNITIDAEYVKSRLESIVKDEDLSKYVL